MQSENFDKKIKEAAEQHSPSHHEEAWEKMETLLNKHLPQKGKNNKMAFLLLLGFLLLGGGTFILVKKPFSNNTSITETKADQQNNTVPESNDNSINTQPVETNSQKQNDIKDDQIEKKELDLNSTVTPPLAENNLKVINKNDDKNITVDNTPLPVKEIPEKNRNKLPPGNQNNLVQEEKKAVPENTKPVNETSVETTQVTNAVNEKKKTTKTKKGFLSNLAFTFSAGPDLSFVEMNDAGRVQFIYGAGLSYPVSKQFTLRSGFFIARKIYTAGPEDYNASYNFWSNYPNLKQIDADCKIYDLALMADYNFGKSRNWFASLGVSNLFMKRETYDYLYKPATSTQYISYSHTFNNENNHYLSVLNISGGYTRKLNNTISVRAEPYLKLPLTGIGHGKIKLGSGGLLITTSITPFASNSNKKP